MINRHCETCGELLIVSQSKFCSRECWLASPEMKKSLNTMNCRNKLKVRRSPKGNEID